MCPSVPWVGEWKDEVGACRRLFAPRSLARSLEVRAVSGSWLSWLLGTAAWRAVTHSSVPGAALCASCFLLCLSFWDRFPRSGVAGSEVTVGELAPQRPGPCRGLCTCTPPLPMALPGPARAGLNVPGGSWERDGAHFRCLRAFRIFSVHSALCGPS